MLHLLVLLVALVMGGQPHGAALHHHAPVFHPFDPAGELPGTK